ncbi:B-cell receptor CD22-like [Anguilla anguilla]|uniref:B-cell receptor CD22-like n=1 Tax=Anguilla anguilla TaxID=7936 RepID=UPI0015AA2370|nr:B-cell receptor CD22-like [Anguilla anguilla]
MLLKILLVIVLSVSGVLCQWEWGVTYTPERICALKGSSVDMRCTYSYPPYCTVQKTFWFIHWNEPQGPEDLSQDSEYTHRVEYLGNQNSDCTFRINQLKESDSAIYRFRFLTDSQHGKYFGQPGVSLTVTGLQVKVTENEAQSVTLTCSSTCTLSGSSTFTWYKNGEVVPYEYKYSLNVASTDDTDLYSCATGGVTSPAVNVKYPPKSVSVSVSPSGEIVEGSSVTLTCSSDTNTPVQKYTWLKKTGSVFSRRGSERSYIIKNITLQDAGEYYCVVENAIRAERSPPKHLDVQCEYISASQLQTHRAESQYLLSIFRKLCNRKTLSKAVTLASEGRIL